MRADWCDDARIVIPQLKTMIVLECASLLSVRCTRIARIVTPASPPVPQTRVRDIARKYAPKKTRAAYVETQEEG